MMALDDRQTRRNAISVAVAQALYGAASTILIVTAGLVGAQLSSDPSWATLPVSTFVIGTALTTLPVSLLMRRIGRKAGFMLGSFAGMAGGLLGVYTIFQQSFGIFLSA
jgi:MFS family permease